MFHACTKYIKIDYTYIHERIQSKDIQVLHINSIDQPTYLLNKSLSSTHFQQLQAKKTIQPMAAHFEGRW